MPPVDVGKCGMRPGGAGKIQSAHGLACVLHPTGDSFKWTTSFNLQGVRPLSHSYVALDFDLSLGHPPLFPFTPFISSKARAGCLRFHSSIVMPPPCQTFVCCYLKSGMNQKRVAKVERRFVSIGWTSLSLLGPEAVRLWDVVRSTDVFGESSASTFGRRT